MFKNKKQLLYRFLKENKLFTNEVVKTNIILTRHTDVSVGIFDEHISWCGTIEGYKFWLKTQCDFLLFIIKHDVNNLFKKSVVQNKLEHMIRRCKNESRFDNSYESLIEFYSQYLEN